MQFGATWCRLVHFGAALWNLVQFVETLSRVVLFGADWCRLVELAAALCSLVHLGADW